MRQHKYFGLLMILASAFLFVQCTSELPEPIQGPPGVDGQNGVDGQDGVSGTASCVSCHNNTLRGEIAMAFDGSAHGSGSISFAEGRVGCAQCHGNDGFIDFIETGSAPGPYSFRSPMECMTCHSSHRTFDFDNDGDDFALRNPDPTPLLLAPNTTLDFGDASNNCISCHQPRNSFSVPDVNSTQRYLLDDDRFGVHYAPQSTVLQGILGSEISFEGSLPYPAPGTATHRTASSCVQCHMGDSPDAATGGHTWTPIVENCIDCHGQDVPTEATDFTQDLATLKSLLEQVVGEEIARDADGDPILDANGDPVGTGNPVVGIILDDYPDPGEKDRSQPGIYSNVAVVAAWNYMTIVKDHSKGVHNPDYTKALLKNSIAALQNEN